MEKLAARATATTPTSTTLERSAQGAGRARSASTLVTDRQGREDRRSSSTRRRSRAYRLIGYENRLLTREDFNDDKKDAGEIGAGHTVTALYEIAPVGGAARRSTRCATQREAAAAGRGGEIAFLQACATSCPARTRSARWSAPSPTPTVSPRSTAVPPDLRFAAAVAGFGQKLRRDPRVAELGFADIRRLAGNVLGADPYGDRREFLELVDTAGELASTRRGRRRSTAGMARARRRSVRRRRPGQGRSTA